MKTIWQTGTPYARIHDNGQIERLDGHAGPSESWKVTGAVRLNNFGYVVERFTLDQVLSEPIQWQHKNGSQRVHICDLDHGTHRTWMSPYHKVA